MPTSTQTRIAGTQLVLNDTTVQVNGLLPISLANWIASVEARLEHLGAPLTSEMVLQLQDHAPADPS